MRAEAEPGEMRTHTRQAGAGPRWQRLEEAPTQNLPALELGGISVPGFESLL